MAPCRQELKSTRLTERGAKRPDIPTQRSRDYAQGQGGISGRFALGSVANITSGLIVNEIQ